MAVFSLLKLPRRGLRLAGICGLILFCLVVAASARAEGETLYGALILATSVEHPTPPPVELRTQAENLRIVFGYNEFRVLGQRSKLVSKGTEDWLVPSRQFFLRVDTKNPVAGGYALGLELRKEDRVIVEADVKLNRDRPLFIKGPLVAQGQLIILLMVL